MQLQTPPNSTTRCEAFNLAVALDAYEMTCTTLVARWYDADLCRQAGIDMAAIREHGIRVPTLIVHALHLAIAHYELEAALWQKISGERTAQKLHAALDRHAIAVQGLRLAARKTLIVS